MSNPQVSGSPDKQPILLLIYGAGGHKTEMTRLLNYLKLLPAMSVVSLGDGPLKNELAHYRAQDVRSKVSRWRSVCLIVPTLLSTLTNLIAIQRRYKVVGVVSTGPGICILPMLFFRLCGVKTVFLETFCRFQTRSFTGRIMYKIAHRFLIQNRELQSLYPDAEYSGRL